QPLDRGEVRLRIVEAKVGRIIVEGNRFFDGANIRASLPSLVDGKPPNIRRIARSLRLANDNPAKQTRLLLRGGEEEGTLDAVLGVVDEKPAQASLGLDNAGSPRSGRLRTRFGYRSANFGGGDEVLTLEYIHSPRAGGLDEGNILGASYRVPLYGSGDSIELAAVYSNAAAGASGDPFPVSGAGTQLQARYSANFDKRGDYEHRFILSQDWRAYHDANADPFSARRLPDVSVHPLGAAYLGRYRRADAETVFSFGFFANLAGGNDGGEADFCNPSLRPDAGGACAEAHYRAWKWSFLHNEILPRGFRLRFATDGQFTRDLLVPGEQFGIGGAQSVRGFFERELAGDRGYRGSLEAYTPELAGASAPGGGARALLFLDWGRVQTSPAPGVQGAGGSIGSWGIGLRAAQGSKLELRLDCAFVLDESPAHRRGSARLHGSVSYTF
ncbi:MAG TPA: ShlB/FhaC/HecB family hemolysin secretion/activation protein, partial [Burkholderiales bacterium]|nr:ShlB/FhaC/HecB family hemolysin secretion/activation protein [Burkholderiales bacterium]